MKAVCASDGGHFLTFLLCKNHFTFVKTIQFSNYYRSLKKSCLDDAAPMAQKSVISNWRGGVKINRTLTMTKSQSAQKRITSNGDVVARL